MPTEEKILKSAVNKVDENDDLTMQATKFNQKQL